MSKNSFITSNIKSKSIIDNDINNISVISKNITGKSKAK